jgi:hypothetical protein
MVGVFSIYSSPTSIWSRDAAVVGAESHVDLDVAVVLAPLLEHVAFPVLAAVDVLVEEFVLQAVERQVPVLGWAHHGRIAAEGRTRIFQFLRAQRAAAFFALVAVSIFVTTIGTSSNYISVGQKSLFLFIVILQRNLF